MSPGGPREGPGGTENAAGFLGASQECRGGHLGWFWTSGAILGSVLGDENVDIYLVLAGRLRCYFFYDFSYIFGGDDVF